LAAGAPLLIFDNPLMWLQAEAMGVVVIDWSSVVDHLSGLAALLCSAGLAPRLYVATRECSPVPEVAVYVPAQERRHAA
jgi:hypothetical protein